ERAVRRRSRWSSPAKEDATNDEEGAVICNDGNGRVGRAGGSPTVTASLAHAIKEHKSRSMSYRRRCGRRCVEGADEGAGRRCGTEVRDGGADEGAGRGCVLPRGPIRVPLPRRRRGP